VDLYRKVRLACSEGMSQREAARQFGVSRDSVRKMLAFSVPPGYRRTAPVKRPNELMESRDERRLLRLQKQLASIKLLIIDELGFVPLSKTDRAALRDDLSALRAGLLPKKCHRR